jgi:phosphatidylglycerophosphate synthase
MSSEQMRAQWSALHGGYDAEKSVVLRTWLSGVHGLARPLATAGVSPDVVSCAAMGAATMSAVAASRSPLFAAGSVLASAVLDGVDGGVAVSAGRVTARGARLDRASDRAADVLFGVALARAGAGRAMGMSSGAAAVGFECVRARLTDNGRRGIGRVTIGDRPTRVAVVAGTLLVAGVVDESRAAQILTAGAVVLAASCVVGAVRLVTAYGPRR